MNAPGTPQANVLNITARPAVYIDVYINEMKQTYELATAESLHKQLGLALASLTPPQLSGKDDENELPNQSHKLDALDGPIDGESPLVVDEELSESA